MGHLVAKQAHLNLRERLDKYSFGAPDTNEMVEILRIVFSEEEARIGAQMPMAFTKADVLAKKFSMPVAELKKTMNRMANKGLVFDYEFDGEKYFLLAPTIMAGIFETNMARLRSDIDQKKLAELIHYVRIKDPTFSHSIKKLKTFPLRVVPHESSIPKDTFTEVLDYEKATSIVEGAGKWSLAYCMCRHIAHHMGKDCTKFRLESCMSLGSSADCLIRNGLAKEISKNQALEHLAEVQEKGMVHLADNVQNNPLYLCSCCSCCCDVLTSFKTFSHFEPIFSSNFIATIEVSACIGCGECEKACPVDVIDLVSSKKVVNGKQVKKQARVDNKTCIGCGVCVSKCKFDSLSLRPREKRFITPETTFKRLLMAALETGKLHHLLIEKGGGMGMKVANQLLGAILNLSPTKKILLKEQVKSRFIDFLNTEAKRIGTLGTDL